ncbi:hypothetical protein [Mongoliitalea daihaiensis]|uniref:hypothetical protein n=1 Tax=Mongoliitalea daihaiensis TaxID=2782006 RepID=UPI001F2397C0|nr:hypothetical protein [Mongoliitalea daihaiensis]UJP63794.1 hypothetical protein IPZ59_13265 [Mongoliitalea daihaiensis]
MMATALTYRPLIEITILHDYFLDRGLSRFEEVEAEIQAQRLSNYHWNHFLSLVPSKATSELLANHRLLFRSSRDRWTLIGQLYNDRTPLISLSSQDVLQFFLVVKDPDFLQYTALDLNTSRMLLLANHPPFDHIPSLPAVNEGILESNFLISKEQLARNFIGEMILPTSCIGLLSIAVDPYDPSYEGILAGDGTYRLPLSWTIRFPNRQTFWRYIFQSGEVLTTSQPLPMTKNGFIHMTDDYIDDVESFDIQFPNPSSPSILLENSNAISQIFLTI